MKRVTTLVVLSALLLSACTGARVRLGDVTDVAQIDRSRGERVEVFARGFQLMGFIPIDINDRHERAYAELKKQAGDRMITDVRVEESWKYAVIGTFFTTVYRATLYPKAVAPAASAAPAAPK